MPRAWYKTGKMFLLGLIVGTALVSGGCAALIIGGVAAGSAAAGYAYYQGNDYQDYYNPEFKQVWVATYSALSDVGMPILHYETKNLLGEIQSRGPKGEKVSLYLEPVPNAASVPNPSNWRIHVRVGAFGDQELSQKIHNQIRLRLQQAAPVQPGPMATPAGIPPGNALAQPGIRPVSSTTVETGPPPLAPSSQGSGAAPPQNGAVPWQAPAK